MKIKLGLSNAFKNKENLLGHLGAHNSYVPSIVTPEQFAAHVTSGKAWSMGYFTRLHRHRLIHQQYPVSRGVGRKQGQMKWVNLHRRRKDYWTSSQVLALDFDQGNVSVESALQHPLIAEYAMLIHPSPSSTESFPKTRVVFLLDEPVKSAGRWEALQIALLHEFNSLQPDMACKDAAREFKGSDRPGWQFFPDKVLPLEVAASLAADIAHREMELYLTPAPLTQSFTNGGKNFQEIKDEVKRIIGYERANKPVRCPMANHEHDDRSPSAYWNDEKSFLFCWKCEAHGNGVYNTFAIARRYGIEVDAKKNRMAIRVPKAPEKVTQDIRSILQKSEKLQRQTVSYLASRFNIRPEISRLHLCGGLASSKKIGDTTVDFTRYIIPHYFRDELFGARISVDKLELQKAWINLETEAPQVFDQYHAQFTKTAKYDAPAYWKQVYALIGGEGYLLERRTYNIGAVIERKGERLYPRRSLGLMIVANNNEFDVLNALSVGYCAVGASPNAQLDWIFSGAQHKVVVAYPDEKLLAEGVAKKSGAYAIAYLPAPMYQLGEDLTKICEKYRLFRVGESV